MKNALVLIDEVELSGVLKRTLQNRQHNVRVVRGDVDSLSFVPDLVVCDSEHKRFCRYLVRQFWGLNRDLRVVLLVGEGSTFFQIPYLKGPHLKMMRRPLDVAEFCDYLEVVA